LAKLGAHYGVDTGHAHRGGIATGSVFQVYNGVISRYVALSTAFNMKTLILRA